MAREQSTAGSVVSRTYTGAFAYRTCRPDEYLVKSGAGCGKEQYTKSTFQWPYQRVTVITLSPRNYSFDLHCTSKDLVPFLLPVVFTIGPCDPKDDVDGFHKYATKLSAMTVAEQHEIVLGIVHGQTRLYAAGLTVMEIFNDRDSFKLHVADKIGKELTPLGLLVYNSNIAEMRDHDSSGQYFASLKQRAVSVAVNDARVAVANAKRDGDVGASKCETDAAVQLAEIKRAGDVTKREKDCATAVRLAEIARDQNIAQQESATATDIRKADLAAEKTTSVNVAAQKVAQSKLELDIVELTCRQSEATKRAETENAPKVRAAELAIELNQKEAEARKEQLRATELAKITVESEAAVTLAKGEAASVRLTADAALYAKQKEAEGVVATMEAKAEGMRKLLAVADPELVKFWLALESGLFVSMAEQTAAAVQGLQPKINVWTTGTDVGDATWGPLQKLFQTLPPMLDAVQSQTDIRLPSWIASASALSPKP